MKINEIEQLDEVPAGMIGQAAKKIGSRVLNKVPGGAAKSKAYNIATRADLGDTANQLHKEFNGYLGSQDKTMKQATGDDLKKFITQVKKHQTKANIPSGTLTKQQLNDILMTVAKEAMAKRQGVDQDEKPNDDSSGGDTDGGSGEQSAEIKFAPNQQVKFKSRDGSIKDGVVIDKGKDDDHVKVQSGEFTVDVPRTELINPQTEKPFTPQDKPVIGDKPETPGIPMNIKKQLDALTDQQKQELASLL